MIYYDLHVHKDNDKDAININLHMQGKESERGGGGLPIISSSFVEIPIGRIIRSLKTNSLASQK